MDAPCPDAWTVYQHQREVFSASPGLATAHMNCCEQVSFGIHSPLEKLFNGILTPGDVGLPVDGVYVMEARIGGQNCKGFVQIEHIVVSILEDAIV